MTMIKAAKLSACRTFRYELTREWEGSGIAFAFIGMNPSTADETEDDATIRRCVNYVKFWGGSKLIMVNLFAMRSRNPEVLTRHVKNGGRWEDLEAETNSHANDEALEAAYKEAAMTVCAWGNKFNHTDQARRIHERYGDNLYALRLTTRGAPAHPLFLPADLKPRKWTDNGMILEFQNALDEPEEEIIAPF